MSTEYITFEIWLENYIKKNKITINNILDFKNCWNQAVETCCDYFVYAEGVDWGALKKFSIDSKKGE